MHTTFSSICNSMLITTFPKTEAICGIFHNKSTKEFNCVMKCINNNVTEIINISLQVILWRCKIRFKSLPEAYPTYVNLLGHTVFYRNLFRWILHPAAQKDKKKNICSMVFQCSGSRATRSFKLQEHCKSSMSEMKNKGWAFKKKWALNSGESLVCIGLLSSKWELI